VTHAEAIAHLLAPGTPKGDPGVAAARDATIAHVARCSDCWGVLVALEAPTTGEDADMAARFGCDTVRDTLFALVGLEPATIAREHAAVARHLGWCLACRTRFAEIIDVERERQTVPGWIEMGERVREAVGRLVVRLGRAAAGLVEIPDAFVFGPAAVPVPIRGADGQTEIPRSTRFQLGDTGVWAEIGVDEADATAGLSLRLLATVAEPLSVRVHETRAGGDALVARYTLGGAEPVLVRGLWPGSFVIELHDTRDAAVHRVRVDIGPGA
jgi:hypothetical protein